MQTGDVVAKKYRLNRVLGMGGMATVWAATNVFTERDVAIKVLLPQIATSKEAVDRFLQEAKVSARIDHPNIIDIIDVERSDEGALFLVMELLSGVSLETALKRQNPPMTTTELVFVMVEVARALAAAHRAGVVHRDLKPTNIFLHRERSGKPIPKVLDFGVSKFYEEERSHTALTIAGTVLGSPMYMSPEQARGEIKVDGRTDIFSFGAMLFEALVGFRPYDAPNFNALIVKIATAAPRDIDLEAPNTPETLRAVVRQCLQPTPAARPQTFDEVAEALMAALPELEQAPQPLPGPASGLLPSDPDATNALPVIRASDRPPPGPLAMTPLGGISRGVTAGSGESAIHGFGLRLRERKMRFGAAVGIAASLLVAVVLVATCKGGSTQPPSVVAQPEVLIEPSATATTNAPQAPTAPTGAATANAPTAVTSSAPTQAAEPPSVEAASIAVDSLPVVPKRAVKMGRMAIASTPDPCTLFVDGQRKGKTPLPVVELSAGSHTLTCATAKGRSQTLSVTVKENVSGRHVFRF